MTTNVFCACTIITNKVHLVDIMIHDLLSHNDVMIHDLLSHNDIMIHDLLSHNDIMNATLSTWGLRSVIQYR